MSDDQRILARFETMGDLYYKRFRRLRPGKDEPIGLYRDSNDVDNVAQFDGWAKSTALNDALDELTKIADVREWLRQHADELSNEAYHDLANIVGDP